MDLKNLKLYLLAGNAVFDMVSKKTGERIQFKIVQCPTKRSRSKIPPWFIRRVHPKGWTSFMGTIKLPYKGYTHSWKARIHKDSEAALAFRWLWRHIVHTKHLEGRVTIDHHNKCGKCQRKLTDEDSIARGLGPVCYKTLIQKGEIK